MKPVGLKYDVFLHIFLQSFSCFFLFQAIMFLIYYLFFGGVTQNITHINICVCVQNKISTSFTVNV